MSTTDTPRETVRLDAATIRFAGDSGDGMQLTGTRFTNESAVAGNDLATLPDYPAEIRAPAGTLAGVSSFQLQFAAEDIHTPGDAPDVLVAMNPAALKKHLGALRPDGTLIVDTDAFTTRNHDKAGFDANPLEDGSLDEYDLHPVALTSLTMTALEEFTEDATWVAPSGVEAIEYISLTGGTGTTVAWQATFVSVASIASGNTQSFGLNTLESHAEGEFSKFSGLGSTPQSISGDVMRRLANNFTTNASYSGVYRREPGETVSKAGGSGSGWGETGTWNPGDQLYDWNITGIEQRISDDAPGGDTTGFGHTADGGDIGDPGETVVHESVSIVPEQSYDLTVPSGGKIEIRYYEQGI